MKVRTLPIIGLLTLVAVIPVAGWQTASAAPAVVSTNQALPVLPKNAAGYRGLSVDQLAASMKNKNFTLINVHIPYQGDLPATDLSIPFDKITANLGKLPGKDAPIVVYCRSGSMSTKAATALAAAGYGKVYELRGGFNAWKAAGHHLVTK